jgi:pimeloyl-ACP methyl ester carboxylesterase
LQAVLDALGEEQAVLVPHDASGPVAINRALEHPHRVSALVLLTPTIPRHRPCASPSSFSSLPTQPMRPWSGV